MARPRPSASNEASVSLSQGGGCDTGVDVHPPAASRTPVKPNTLTLVSLLSIILLPFHIAGGVALGLDPGGSGLVFIAAPIVLLVACGTLLLAERRSGHIIMLFGGLVALAMR